MIHAAEALALPAAKTSDSDLAAAKAFLADLDAHVRQHMTPGGVVAMEFDPARLNPTIMMEIGHELRRQGWATEFQQRKQRSSVVGGQEVVVGYQIHITPTDAARDEAARDRPPHGNGVSTSLVEAV